MNQTSLADLAKNEPLEPLLEKEVQVRAYELYEQRGKGQGFALQDWLEAEAPKSWPDFPIPSASAIRHAGNSYLV